MMPPVDGASGTMSLKAGTAASVTATDCVSALLDQASERARADGLEIQFREADAEALPFPAGTFDVVVSTFGVMFTPNQERAAAELARVLQDRWQKSVLQIGRRRDSQATSLRQLASAWRRPQASSAPLSEAISALVNLG
jgi:ubiquinone/menaquinone biosynthesis C-methylase UbiE